MVNQERGGRSIFDDSLDFGWIKTTIELCELNTEMPPRDFAYPIRAIDIQNMCVADLAIEDRYVALSYAWGNTRMVKLMQGNVLFLRTPGSLTKLPDLPQTLRDAITLVRNVGERYLWIDSLCILQDNKVDMEQQMGQMGDLYTHSYFTIFAISGQDANYGVPGVRPGTRKLRQFIQHVRNLRVANSLPFMEQEDLLGAGAWGSRGWTFQERFRSQRGVFIGDNGVIINCSHTYSPEDEHCSHPITRDDGVIARGRMTFFTGQDKRCVPYITDWEPFDSYAMHVFQYTRRKFTYQVDAYSAFLGVLQSLQYELGHHFIHGLPEFELDAALLWSPVGSSIRRCNLVTKQPLFPSWSWLGWVGSCAYPWTLERDTFISAMTSPLQWQDAAIADNRVASNHAGASQVRHPSMGSQEVKDEDDGCWFTSDDLGLPPSATRASILRILSKRLPDHLGLRRLSDRSRKIQPAWLIKHQIDWPSGLEPSWQYVLPKSHRLSFRTLVVHFYVIGRPFQRHKLYNMEHPIYRLSIVDENGHLVGYIDIPDPASRTITLGRREFAVLSRSTIDGQHEPPPDSLGETRRRARFRPLQSSLEERSASMTQDSFGEYRALTKPNTTHNVGNFDTVICSERRPWCMFNVIMLCRPNGRTDPAYRDTIGRIHVDACLAGDAHEEIIDLE